MTDTPEFPPGDLVATVRRRAAGGLLLQVHAVTDDQVAARILLVILQDRGWQDASLDPYHFPGFSAGVQLVTYGYMRGLPENNSLYGWTLADRSDGLPVPGRAFPSVDGPVWRLPVYRLTSGAFDPIRCLCGPSQPHLSMCYLCPPERQERIYAYACLPAGSPRMDLV